MLKNGYLLTMADSFNNGIISETLFFRFETNAITEEEKNIAENKLASECQNSIIRALLDIDITIERFLNRFNA
jgi:hypothetical protein